MDQHQISKEYVYDLFLKFFHQMEQFEEHESELLLEELRKTIAIEGSMNMTEIHVIACVGQHEPINLTSVAEKMELSKGNISKVTNKLLKQGWLRKTQLNDNKKEIFFRLTPTGKKLFAVHEKLHEKAQEQFMGFLSQYDGSELAFIKKLMLDILSFYEQRMMRKALD